MSKLQKRRTEQIPMAQQGLGLKKNEIYYFTMACQFFEITITETVL